MNAINIRPATPDDLPVIHELLLEHAQGLGMGDQVVATPTDLGAAFFAKQPTVFCDLGELDGAVVGLTIWFYSFSTFAGRRGIYIEDMFILPGPRVAGLPLAFARRLARRCVDEGLARLEWCAQDDNRVAINIFKAVGATSLTEWTTWRWTGLALAKMAGGITASAMTPLPPPALGDEPSATATATAT